MHGRLQDRLIQKHVFDKIGSFYFYDNFMISEIAEGVTVGMEMVLEVTHKYTKKYYSPNTPFVYIANRVNSYSIQPTIHFETKKLLPNTKGYAIVSYNAINNKIASLEKPFLSIPMQIFNTLEDAVSWAEALIRQKD